MAESVVLSLLTEVAKPLVKVVVSRVSEEIHFFRKFERELNHLLEKILMIASTVNSMPDTTVDKAVELWLRKALRIIHDAENLMDLLAYDKHRSVVMKRRPKKITRLVFSPLLKRVYFRRKMGSCIRRINSNIEAALKEARTINQLKALVPSASASSQRAATNITIDQELLQQVRQNVHMKSLFIGRDLEVDSVVNKLLYNPCQNSEDKISNNRLSVVAIVGLGGMGKTALAKNVHDNNLIRSHFSERIWISDLKDFHIERILNRMVEYLKKGDHKYADSEITMKILEKLLGGKRYLLVLDDVWNTNQVLWNSMRDALESIGGSKDSKVLTTTRSDAVAEAMHASSILHLSGLLQDASWSLFKQIAFEDRDSFELKAIGKKIVEKCQGVPLAIKSIAGLLHNKKQLYDWTKIEESELWDIPPNETGILPSLKLSYEHLSPALKKCFSLCAIWPKNIVFKKYEIRDRWIALGLVEKSDDETMTLEDNCEAYINQLLGISFLLVRERNEVGEAIRYYLHDLVYELARLMARHELLYLEAGDKVKKDDLDIRHLTVVGLADISLDVREKLVLENIRTLEIFHRYPRELLMHVKYLRVLCLERLGLEVVPESIGQLKCLKYLDLASNPIKVLPECIMELYSLQSLILYHCSPLSELPGRRLSNLINLRHLGLSFYLCPAEGMIRLLTELQSLPPLQLSEGGLQIAELEYLCHIRGNLEIKGLQLIKSKLNAEQSKLSMKSRVEQLRLSWDNDDNYIKHEEVLDGLHPNPNLKLLSIKGYGGENFPSWLMRMNVPEDRNNGYAGILYNLIKIELIDCGRCQQLPTMGHLPLLKMIEIRNMKLEQIGPELYGDVDLLVGSSNEASSSGSSPRVKSMVYFESLKELRLSGLEDLEEWCEPATGLGKWDGFPSLEVLVIEECWDLEEAPNKFPNLKELIVRCMVNSNPLMKIMRNKGSVSNLTKLEIVQVEELTHIPEEVGERTSLQELIIKWCHKLESIPNISGLGSLRQLELLSNNGLRGAPEGLESCKLLEDLGIDCCGKVETLPDLSGLSRVRSLGILGMRKMIRQPPDWIFNLPSLRILHIGNYDGLEEFPDMRCLLKMTCLEELQVYGWEELQNIPVQLQYFTALKILSIAHFNKVEQLPDWLGNLSSLRTLRPCRCKSLKELPSRETLERLPNFYYLKIEDCPLLAKAVDKDGSEYHKIAAPHIRVDIINSNS